MRDKTIYVPRRFGKKKKNRIEKCVGCGKTVYKMDKQVKIEGSLYHQVNMGGENRSAYPAAPAIDRIHFATPLFRSAANVKTRGAVSN